MRFSQTLALGVICIGLVTACSQPKQNQNVTYLCGAQPIHADFSKQLTLRINDKTLRFEQEPTASGTRYFSRDYEAEFWTKNQEAQLVIGADIYPLCVVAGDLPKQFSARGNEPFWLLQRKGDIAALRRPSGDRDFIDIETSEAEGIWTIKLDEVTSLTLSEAVCRDNMTGM